MPHTAIAVSIAFVLWAFCLPPAQAETGGKQGYILLPGETMPVYAVGQKLAGVSAWYGQRAQGRRTANGEVFDYNRLTAAHRTLPFGAVVKVINRRNGKSVRLRITDRGPKNPRYAIDITRRAAELNNMRHRGTAPVSIEIIELPAWYVREHPSR